MPKKTFDKPVLPVSGSELANKPDRAALVLLRRVMSGEFPPGSRLPALSKLRLEIAPHLSMTTFHQEVQLLCQLGFLEAKARSHTKVPEELPNRNRFAVVFPQDPANDVHTALRPVIHRSIQAYCNRHPGFEVEYHFYNPQAQGHAARLAAMVHRVRWHEVAGMWFLCSLWEDDPFYNEPGLARVQFVPMPEYRKPWMKRFARTEGPGLMDGGFMGIALRRMASAGCCKVAVIRPMVPKNENANVANIQRPAWKPIIDEIRRLGMETRPEWVLNVGGSGWETGRLLMSLPERPDALIVDDDALIPSITAGMASMPQPWPTIVGLANFPSPPEASLPIIFGGFDIQELTNWSLDTLRDPVRQTKTPAYLLKAHFEDGWQPQPGNMVKASQ
jgi:hypothetical protein